MAMARISRLRLGVAAWALIAPATAWANCATTTAGDGTVTLTCGDTITNSSVNHNGNTPSTNADLQGFEAPLDVTISSGATISGWGLYVGNGTGGPPAGTLRPLNVVNNGRVSHTVAWSDTDENDGFVVSTNSGSIHYSGNGSATTNGTTGDFGFRGATALLIYASGVGNSTTVGSQAAPITGATFTGEAGVQLVAENGSLDAWFAGGTITATRQDDSFGALTVQAADTINLNMTGGTVVNGGIGVSITAGPGHSASSKLTIATDAHVTSTYSAGAGLTAFSREAGGDVTLASGASINVANVGVLLNPNAGQVRFTTAAGSTISQTGTTGAAKIGVWLNPFGTGSLLADLSGSIAATGTGILLQPLNGNASVTIRAGGSVNGDQTGIQVVQTTGGTGAVDIHNLGTLSGAIAVDGTPAGTAFTLANSGTMTGRVNVTGSSVANSLLTNSGTWNLGAGNSAFSGSVTNSGLLNMADGAINTLTIGGNLVMSGGSIFRFDVGSGVSDRVNVTGTTTLGGGVAAFATGVVLEQGTYTLLTAAGGVSGTFNALSTNPNATAHLSYDANNVFLVLDQQTGFTATASTTERVVLNPATVTTNQVNRYSTTIIGRIEGGTPLYNQTFAEAFAAANVQNGVTAARAAITAAGGPGVIIGNPVRTASNSSTATVSSSVYSLAGTATATTAEIVVGPGSTTIGQRSVCTGIGTLPSASLPTCGAGSATTYTVNAGQVNTNTNVETTYTINQARTDTVTTTLSETYEITGQVAAVGSIHAEVQSGLFDLGGRLLGRLAGPLTGNAGWGEIYGFRVRQGGRRDATGFAAGFNLALAPQWSLAGGIDRGNLDIDVPGAAERADVTLTEGGAALRFDGGAFTAALSASYGTGNAETQRTIVGSSAARYDVRVGGVALELGYGFDVGGWQLRPVAGLDYVSVHTDGFSESDTLGLQVAGRHSGRTRASAGLELARSWGGIEFAASARYLAVLDGRERTIPVAFALAPTRLLDMTAAREPDTALIGARARIPVSGKASVYLGYDGRFGGNYTSHAGTAGFTLSW